MNDFMGVHTWVNQPFAGLIFFILFTDIVFIKLHVIMKLERFDLKV